MYQNFVEDHLLSCTFVEDSALTSVLFAKAGLSSSSLQTNGKYGGLSVEMPAGIDGNVLFSYDFIKWLAVNEFYAYVFTYAATAPKSSISQQIVAANKGFCCPCSFVISSIGTDKMVFHGRGKCSIPQLSLASGESQFVGVAIVPDDAASSPVGYFSGSVRLHVDEFSDYQPRK